MGERLRFFKQTIPKPEFLKIQARNRILNTIFQPEPRISVVKATVVTIAITFWVFPLCNRSNAQPQKWQHGTDKGNPNISAATLPSIPLLAICTCVVSPLQTLALPFTRPFHMDFHCSCYPRQSDR